MMHQTWWTQRSQAVKDEISKSFVRNKKVEKKRKRKRKKKGKNVN